MIGTRPARILVLGALSLAVLSFGCDCWINSETADAWQRNMNEALVAGYRNFRALDCSADIAWYLFSYDLPPNVDPARVLPMLRVQIDSTVPPMFAVERPGSPKSCWSPVLESATELQLQCKTVTYGSPGYDEWRFLVDPSRRRVTAMYSNLDSPVEREQYTYLLSAFRKAHAAQ